MDGGWISRLLRRGARAQLDNAAATPNGGALTPPFNATAQRHCLTPQPHPSSRNHRTPPAAGGNGTRAATNSTGQAARSGWSTSQQAQARPRRLRCRPRKETLPPPSRWPGRRPLTSTSNSRPGFSQTRSSSPQRQRQFLATKLQPWPSSSLRARCSAQRPWRWRGVGGMGGWSAEAGTHPLRFPALGPAQRHRPTPDLRSRVSRFTGQLRRPPCPRESRWVQRLDWGRAPPSVCRIGALPLDQCCSGSP